MMRYLHKVSGSNRGPVARVIDPRLLIYKLFDSLGLLLEKNHEKKSQG